VADARAELRRSQADLLAAAAERDRALDEVRHAVRARELRMEVKGPHTIQPGAPADYLVSIKDLNNQPAAADIVARLQGDERSGFKATSSTAKDDRGKPADAKPAGPADGTLRVTPVEPGLYRVSIPPTLRLDRAGRPPSSSPPAKRASPPTSTSSPSRAACG